MGYGPLRRLPRENTMRQQVGAFGCIAIASLLVIPIAAWTQEKKEAVPPPVVFTGPLSGPRSEDADEGVRMIFVLGKGLAHRRQLTINATEDRRCYGYVEFSLV